MALSIMHTPVYCTDLDEALAFYTQRLGFEVRDDVPMGPEMRWLTVHAPGDLDDLPLVVDTTTSAATAGHARDCRQGRPAGSSSRLTTWTKASSSCRPPPGRRSSRSPSTSPTVSVTPPSATLERYYLRLSDELAAQALRLFRPRKMPNLYSSFWEGTPLAVAGTSTRP